MSLTKPLLPCPSREPSGRPRNYVARSTAFSASRTLIFPGMNPGSNEGDPALRYLDDAWAVIPRELFDAADALLTGHTARGWRCWQRHQPSMAGATMRTQLLVLSELAGAEAAVTARGAWAGLCRAVHHHSYELAPTAAELRTWHRDVTTLLGELPAR